ncbi:MAG: hypothetical protein CO186_03925 [Zetaproteobacteria bacterium CG_4_9_14_3_um_filter_49_83]|nr:MAG: hypothetical protein AUJ56_08745 [Zetaproteobacteria bacterium CG1_02_49_23]PIQ30515.1 MAG: hypothetical protein COW62_12190 [Zetaproteobacteria bacterium CG17_big_fil_post_rev_8_21_14_2_50_50_13]PIV30927.1 MAG: hypothetical protein COS35_04075 [Zetaproteobacteria bacterium CG02_land_8_20_14_3_00_50_9]PIY55537.1 MAG: hypothetical protein COZ00_08905 [Zetaproteobacteria bacterium CG_4_10_14_0_8_um_filter_49_80]PJA35818.1 MAG: hypothetical protein CO186_03925 [Zetaproteobacteria bacterium
MRRKSNHSNDSFYEIFSDMALLMLAAFIFLFALILINAQLQGAGHVRDSADEIDQLKESLAKSEKKNEALQREVASLAGADLHEQMQKIMESAGVSNDKAKRDFDMFVEGLRNLPGTDLHLVVDATGSMHGVTTFLIPVLRVIAIRSGKHLSAVSWYADRQTGTFTGEMGEMFDQLMQNAPFIGADETIGHTFEEITKTSPAPSAYMLIGDEPPSDTVYYKSIPSPVFTLPLGTSDNASTVSAYRKIADETGGRILKLKFQ